MNNIVFRTAEPRDMGLILDFIGRLAEYEHMTDDVVSDEAVFREWLFEKKAAEVVFAVADGKEVGFALYFQNFSTFLGKAGLYLEDLFVLPDERGKGYGKALLRHLAGIAVKRGYGRMEWACLDWNRPSIDFYRSMGAVPMNEWTVYRLTGDALSDAAKQ